MNSASNRALRDFQAISIFDSKKLPSFGVWPSSMETKLRLMTTKRDDQVRWKQKMCSIKTRETFRLEANNAPNADRRCSQGGSTLQNVFLNIKDMRLGQIKIREPFKVPSSLNQHPPFLQNQQRCGNCIQLPSRCLSTVRDRTQLDTMSI